MADYFLPFNYPWSSSKEELLKSSWLFSFHLCDRRQYPGVLKDPKNAFVRVFWSVPIKVNYTTCTRSFSLYIRQTPEDFLVSVWKRQLNFDEFVTKIIIHLWVNIAFAHLSYYTAYHGRDGPIKITNAAEFPELQETFLRGAEEVGDKRTDVNGKEQKGMSDFKNMFHF